jgi:hypothetical protein
MSHLVRALSAELDKLGMESERRELDEYERGQRRGMAA